MPNFFVIGANKSGTTSLYQYLNQHPDVYMCPVKEPSYFKPTDEQVIRKRFPGRKILFRNVDEYLELFSGATNETAIGEASTSYLPSPIAAENIRQTVPEAKLVAILRNPVERAFSAYSMHVAFRHEDLSFADAVALELATPEMTGTWKRHYVRNGFYGRHLTHYLEHFDRKQLRVYLYEDLDGDLGSLLRDLFEYLGVDAAFAPETTTRYNITRYPPRHRSVDRLLRVRSARRIARRMLPEETWIKTKEYVRRRNSVRHDFPVEVRQRLLDLYRDDIALTQQLIDRDLSAWRT